MFVSYKKILTAGGVAAAVFTAAACGQGDPEESPGGGTEGNNDETDYEEETAGAELSDDEWDEAFEEDLHYTDQIVTTYFLEADDNTIQLNISDARADYHFEELDADAVDDMMYIMEVEKADDMEIVDREGEALSVDDLYEGDIIYLAYDISEYDEDGTGEVTTDLLVKEEVSKDGMLSRVAPPEGSGQLYIGIVSREGEGWGDLDERDLEFLLDYSDVRGYGDIIHQDGVPAYDYVEAFELEEDLPVIFAVGEEGLEYKSDDLDDVVDYIEDR